MRIRILTALVSLGLITSMPSARATFPGTNGLIVFQHDVPAGDHDQVDLLTVRADGSHLRQITNTPDKNEFDPVWNKQGTLIAIWRNKAPFGFGSLWVMAPDGSNQRRLTQGVDARTPTWNPDGTRLAYTGPGISGGETDIWTLRVSDGKDRHRVTSGKASDFEAAWSPDGTRIAFTRSIPHGSVGNIFVIDLNTKVVTRLTRTSAYDHQVEWSPDGQQLVFERDFSGTSSIFVIDADGSNLTRLTSGNHFDVGPTFSPDGKLILFGTDRPGQFFDDLWVMNADGSDKHLFLHLDFGEGFPDWQARAA